METPAAKDPKKTVYMVVWVILLILIGWPLAWFVSPIWIFLMPFEAILQPLQEVSSFLEKMIMWPRMLGKAIVEGRDTFPDPTEQTTPADTEPATGYFGSACV